MTRALWSLVAWTVVAVSGALAQSTVRLPGAAWSLTLPTTWKLVDEQTLAKMNRDVAQSGLRTPTGPVRYVMMAVSQEGDGCYMLVQQGSAMPRGATFDQYVQQLQASVSKEIKEAERQLGDAVSATAVSAPEVDHQRKLAILTGQMTVTGVGNLKYLSCPRLGAAETITLHIYAPEKVFEAKRPQFRGIIDSLAFDPGREYAFAAKPLPGFDVKQVLMYGLIGGAAGLVVALVRKLKR